MARFINQDPFVNTGFKATSLDEMSRLPLMLAARDEANINAGYDALDKLYNVAIPENEKAREIHQQKINELKGEIGSLVDTINRNGSLDPSVMQQMRTMKSNYNQMVSQNGLIGRMADDRTTIDAQRIASRQDAMLKGHPDEAWKYDFDKQEKSFYDNSDWNDFNRPRFISTLSPDKETIENVVGKFNLGSITTSDSNSGVTAVPDGYGGVTFNYDSEAHASSSNIAAINELSSYVSNQIKNENSPLMRSAIYSNPGKSIDEVRQIIIDDAKHLINARIVSNRSDSYSNDIKYSEAPNITGVDTDPASEKKKQEDEERMGEITSSNSGLQETDDFKDSNYLNDVYSGKESKRVEALEAMLNSMPESKRNTKEYKDLMKKVTEGKHKISSMKYQLDEIVDNQDNDEILSKSLKEVKSSPANTNQALIKYKVNGKTELGNFFNNTASFRNLRKDNMNFTNAINNNSTYAKAARSLDKNLSPNVTPHEGINSITVKDGRKRYISEKKRDLLPTEIEMVNKQGISFYQGKEAVRKFLELEGITFDSDEDYLKFNKLYKDKYMTDMAISAGTTRFFNNVYNENGNMSFTSNILTLGSNPKVREAIDKGTTSIGGGAIIGEFKSNDTMNFIYDGVDGKTATMTKVKDLNDDEKAALKTLETSPDTKYQFYSIVERGAGRRGHILFNVTTGEGKDKVSKIIGIEINPKSGQGAATDINTRLIKTVIDNLQEPSKSQVQAVYDDALYYNMYVDDETIGKSGISSNQLQQNRMVLPSDLAGDPNYKKVSPMADPSKSNKGNVVYHKNGYYSYNYSGNDNVVKSVTLGDFTRKELVANQLNDITLLKENRVTGDKINSTYLKANPGAGKVFVKHIFQVMEQIDKGVIFVNETTLNYIRQNKDALRDADKEQDLGTQINAAIGIYNYIENTPLMHKNRTKGI